MAEEVSMRKYLQNVNNILKENGAPDTSFIVNVPKPEYNKCASCGCELFIPAVRIPKSNMKSFYINISQKFICQKCGTELDLEL